MAARRRDPIELLLPHDVERVAEAYPTSEPLVNDGGIVTFANQFPDGFDVPTLPPGVEEDVRFLRSGIFPSEPCYGNGASLHPFLCSPARPHKALPTAGQVVADLLVEHFYNPATDLSAVHPPYVYTPTNGADYIHTAIDKQFLFYYGFPARDSNGEAQRAFWDASTAALEALRARVLDGHLYHVVIHPRRPVAAEERIFHKAVLLWTVGVSRASGALMGVWALSQCWNLCD
eukprot:TRINITY_DN3001_c0_g1_i7.p2 TRINITY_DN3001_c0_g1~~TRINITY_DN3001_c0_g1_i7.p2  ORF type:complete len:232 (-),score=63.71 TRINITY_DN3001_c0_g1_i7:308-1003(-)